MAPYRLSLSNYIDSIRDKRTSDRSAIAGPQEDERLLDISSPGDMNAPASPNQTRGGRQCLNRGLEKNHGGGGPLASNVSLPLDSVHEHHQETTGSENSSPDVELPKVHRVADTHEVKTQADVHPFRYNEHANALSNEQLQQSSTAVKQIKNVCKADCNGGADGRCHCDCECCRNGEAHAGNAKEARSISDVRPPPVQLHSEVPLLLQNI